MRWDTLTISLLICAVLLVEATSADYYVRADGTAPDAQSAQGPCDTQGGCMDIATLNSEAVTGIVYFCDDGGEFTAQPDWQSDTVYEAASGQAPVFTQYAEVNWNGPDGNGEYYTAADYATDSEARMQVLEDGERLDGNSQSYCDYTAGELEAGQWTVTFGGVLYYRPSSGALGDHTVEVGYINPRWDYYFPRIPDSNEDTVLRGLSFKTLESNIEGTRTIIENCTFRYGDSEPVRFFECTDCELRDSTIEHFTRRAVTVQQGVSGLLFDNNLIQYGAQNDADSCGHKDDVQGICDNGKPGTEKNVYSNNIIRYIGNVNDNATEDHGSTIGILFDGSEGCKAVHNYIYSVGKMCLQIAHHNDTVIGAEPNDNLMAWNICKDGGWMVEADQGSGCLEYAVGGSGTFTRASTNNTFAHNTCYNWQAGRSGDLAWAQPALIKLMTTHMVGVSFMNNILYGGEHVERWIHENDQVFGTDTIEFKNNLYYGTTQSDEISYDGSTYTSLADFCAGTGHECNGVDNQDPDFVDTTDLELNTGSPAVDAGYGWTTGIVFDNDNDQLTDSDGNPLHGSGLDIGAQEYIGISGSSCGDGSCNGDETCMGCPQDCGECCGNGQCEPGYGENCSTCIDDCGQCLIFARAVSDPIIIDAEDDLPACSQNNISYSRSVSLGGPADNRSDVSAVFKLAWDPENLYVYVAVKDESIMNDSAILHNDDSIELYIDAGNDKASEYDADDFQLTTDIRNRHSGINSSGVGFVTAVRHTGDGYAVEYSVPWQDLEADPDYGMTIGLDLAVNDDDDGGDRDTQIVWNGDGSGWQDPSQFGEVMLVHGADIDRDGEISSAEMDTYIHRWLEGTVSFAELMAGLQEWKGG